MKRLFTGLPRMTANFAVFLVKLSWFGGSIIAFYIIYRLILGEIFEGSKEIFWMFIIWLLTSYIVIPRAHKVLSKFYVPNYFVGRIRSANGLLADPINLAFFGKENDIHTIMKSAGWSIADPLTPTTIFKTAYACIVRQSYPNAPVGRMYLFERLHNFAYQIEVDGSPNKRHHIRFWRVPEGWRLPGGHKADWLAAATYDTHVGIKMATGQIDHYIHEDVDGERDYIVKSLKQTKKIKKIEVIEHFTDAFHDRNNGGDRIKTDGSLPFIYL